MAFLKSVIKRNGKLEPFDEHKIRSAIERAAHDAGFSPNEVKDYVDGISRIVLNFAKDKERIETKVIRDVILLELDSRRKQISDAWRRFDKEEKGLEDEVLSADAKKSSEYPKEREDLKPEEDIQKTPLYQEEHQEPDAQSSLYKSEVIQEEIQSEEKQELPSQPSIIEEQFERHLERLGAIPRKVGGIEDLKRKEMRRLLKK